MHHEVLGFKEMYIVEFCYAIFFRKFTVVRKYGIALIRKSLSERKNHMMRPTCWDVNCYNDTNAIRPLLLVDLHYIISLFEDPKKVIEGDATYLNLRS